MNPRLFLDRNFAVGMFFIFIIGITYLASLALMTPYLQTLMGYPVVTAGIVMGPRGLGHDAVHVHRRQADRQGRHALAPAGRPRLTAWAMYDMTGWTPDVSQWTIIVTGFIQGAGLGFLFVPLTTVTFATLAGRAARRRHRPLQPVAQYRLQRRHLGRLRAAGENVQVNHADIAAYVTPSTGVRQPGHRSSAEPMTRGRPRRARRHGHARRRRSSAIWTTSS